MRPENRSRSRPDPRRLWVVQSWRLSICWLRAHKQRGWLRHSSATGKWYRRAVTDVHGTPVTKRGRVFGCWRAEHRWGCPFSRVRRPWGQPEWDRRRQRFWHEFVEEARSLASGIDRWCRCERRATLLPRNRLSDCSRDRERRSDSLLCGDGDRWTCSSICQIPEGLDALPDIFVDSGSPSVLLSNLVLRHQTPRWEKATTTRSLPRRFPRPRLPRRTDLLAALLYPSSHRVRGDVERESDRPPTGYRQVVQTAPG